MVRVLDREDVQRLGVQDTAVAALVTRLAEDQDAGRDLPLGGC